MTSKEKQTVRKIALITLGAVTVAWMLSAVLCVIFGQAGGDNGLGFFIAACICSIATFSFAKSVSDASEEP